METPLTDLADVFSILVGARFDVMLDPHWKNVGSHVGVNVSIHDNVLAKRKQQGAWQHKQRLTSSHHVAVLIT